MASSLTLDLSISPKLFLDSQSNWNLIFREFLNRLTLPCLSYLFCCIMGKQSARETEQRDEKIKKNSVPAVLGYANNFQDNYFQGQILTFYLL